MVSRRSARPLAARRPSVRPAHRHSRRSPPLIWMLIAAASVGVLLFVASRFYGSHRVPVRTVPAPPVAARPSEPRAEGAAAGDDDARFVVSRLKELPDRARDARLAADALAARGLAAEALDRLEREALAAPANLEIKAAQASLLMEQQRFAEASRLFAEIIEAQPRDPEPRRRFAEALLGLKRYAEAYDMARWYLDAVPGDLAGRKLAARICLDGGWHDQALVHLRSIADSRQEDVETRQLFALAYLRLGQYVKAVSQLNELARSQQPDPSTFYNLALAYARQSQAGETIRVLTRAVELFSAAQVLQWMADADFEPLHNDPLFRTFRAQLNQQSTADVVSLAPRSNVPSDREIGLMPSTLQRGVPELKR